MLLFALKKKLFLHVKICLKLFEWCISGTIISYSFIAMNKKIQKVTELIF